MTGRYELRKALDAAVQAGEVTGEEAELLAEVWVGPSQPCPECDRMVNHKMECSERWQT